MLDFWDSGFFSSTTGLTLILDKEVSAFRLLLSWAKDMNFLRVLGFCTIGRNFFAHGLRLRLGLVGDRSTGALANSTLACVEAVVGATRDFGAPGRKLTTGDVLVVVSLPNSLVMMD